MSMFLLDSAMAAAFWVVIKASVLVGLAAILQGVLNRRTSAATRHLVWMLAIVGVLSLPVLSLALPEWSVVIRTAPAAAAAPDVDRMDKDKDEGRHRPVNPTSSSAVLAVNVKSAPTAPRPREFSWSTAVVGVYAAGAAVMLMQLTLHRWSVKRIARNAAYVQDVEWMRLLADCASSLGVDRPVRLLRSRERTIPMAFGTRRPAILIPAVSDTWPPDRRRAVVLHELAHVARYDCLTQTLAFVARAMYWFHPAVWWVARRARIEQELACDDRVIAAGTQARDYAGHLLEIAYAFGGQRMSALALSMARPRQLESRMLAALDDARNRSVPPFRVRIAGAAIAAALLVPLALARPTVVAASAPSESAPFPLAPAAAAQQDPAVGAHLDALKRTLEAVLRMAGIYGIALNIPQDNLPGTWEIRPSDTKGTVRLRLAELNSSSSSNVPIETLEGLTATQLSAAGGPVQFRLRRDAGIFTFEGIFRNGVGAGTFTFTPDANFGAELAKRGFARPTAQEQYQMARHDIGFAFVEELTKQGYSKPQTSELVRAGQHGVSVAYLREMGALGYRLGSLEPLITLRDHGVTPTYIRELADLGYKKLSADEIRGARDHGITPEYVQAMREAGYGSLPMDELINARDHGVTPDFVRELGDAGYRKLPLDQLIRVRDHGVSPEYVRDMRQMGHSLPVEELIRARDHGVSVDFVRDFAALGYANLPIDSLVRLRDHGVTPTFAQELKKLGYDRLSVDDLVTLRDHGLTTDRIRAANARAGTRLPVDMLKSVAAGGGVR
jgi:beta-lactamase regulating signal transducer with metallopeptidase domain